MVALLQDRVVIRGLSVFWHVNCVASDGPSCSLRLASNVLNIAPSTGESGSDQYEPRGINEIRVHQVRLVSKSPTTHIFQCSPWPCLLCEGLLLVWKVMERVDLA
jgi:hypothetical protein